jgi:hypothetical protein
MAPCPHRGKADSWRSIWKVPDGEPDLYVVRAEDQRGCEEPLDPEMAYSILDRWAKDYSARAQLLAVYSALRAPLVGRPLTDSLVEETVKPALREAFRLGQLLLIGGSPAIGRHLRKSHMAPCPYQGRTDFWRTIWEIPGDDPDLYIVRAQEQRGCEDPLPPEEAFSILDRWAADQNARGELLGLYNAADAPYLRDALSDSEAQHPVKTVLREAFRRGRLLLIRAPWLGIGPGAAEGLIKPVQSAAPPPPVRQTPKTWIEIRLVDMEGHPVPGKHYLIKTPSGAVEEGHLDGDGRARVNGIDPGTCMIGFPELDGEAWERAT